MLFSGVCIPIHMNECVNVTSWTLTAFPNILGHTSATQALAEANKYAELFYGPCAKDFWCTIWNPKCSKGGAQPPCRSYCRGMFLHIHVCMMQTLYDRNINIEHRCFFLLSVVEKNHITST